MFPSRYVNLDAARRRFGDRVDRFGAFLTKGDPRADAVVEALAGLNHHDREAALAKAVDRGELEGAPAELKTLVEEAAHLPYWADFERIERGGRVLFRAGILSAVALSLKSLAVSYASPAGNKPLMFSGRLEQRTVRRLAETGRFVEAVCKPSGMRPFAQGFSTTLRVRLMHAQVRRLLAQSPKWDGGWGLPINQCDMAGTVLLFSLVYLDGLSRLGMSLSAQDRGDVIHLWRFVGRAMGVEDELLCASEDEARTQWALIEATQGPPDEDSRALGKALVESPLTQAKSPEERRRLERFVQFRYALGRYLIGDVRADELGYPHTGNHLPVLAFVAAATAADRATRFGPLQGLRIRYGEQYWSRQIELGLQGPDASFSMPQALARL